MRRFLKHIDNIPDLNGILANKSKSFIKLKDSRKRKDPTLPSLHPKGRSQRVRPDPTARRPGAQTRGACSPASQLPGLEVRSPAPAPVGSRGRRARGKGWGWPAETRFGAAGLPPAGVWEERHNRSLKVCCRPPTPSSNPTSGDVPPKTKEGLKLVPGSQGHSRTCHNSQTQVCMDA